MSISISRTPEHDDTDPTVVGGWQPPHPTFGPFVNLHYISSQIRRRRVVWVSSALVGLIVGLALIVLVPTKYTASTSLLLAHPPGEDPARDMATDAALLKTRAVSGGAMTRLGMHGAPSRLVNSYKATVLSDDVLRVTASASSSGEAVRRANAVAASFLALRAAEMEAQLASVTTVLRNQESQLNTQLAQITDRINAFPQVGAGQNTAAAFDDLVGSRAATAAAIAQIDNEVQSTSLATTSVIKGSSVVDPASPTPIGKIKPKATRAGAGLLAGLVLGLGWVTLVAVGSGRVRRREDVAASLGAPVGLSLRSAGRRRLRKDPVAVLARPPLDTKRLAAFLRAEMRPRPEGPRGQAGPPGDESAPRYRRAGPPSLAVVAVDWLDAPCGAVLCLATDLAKESRRVVIADLSEGAALFARIARPRATGQLPTSGRADWPELDGEILVVAPGTEDLDETTPWRWANPATGETGDADARDLRSRGEVVIVLASIDAMTGAERIGRWSHDAVVTVTAGHSTGPRLRAVGELLEVADVDVRAVVLLGADQTDDSSGLTVDRDGVVAGLTTQIERDLP